MHLYAPIPSPSATRPTMWRWECPKLLIIIVQMISLQCSQSMICNSLSSSRKALLDMPDLLSSRTNFILPMYALVPYLLLALFLVRRFRVPPLLARLGPLPPPGCMLLSRLAMSRRSALISCSVSASPVDAPP